MLVQSFIERLRPLVGIKSWDYIVLWKLSNDHRCIEWTDCCCAGSEHTEDGRQVLDFPASSSSLPCRDVMFPHPRIIPCDLLHQLPSSMLLDSGVHAQTLMSNQASWLNFSYNSDSFLSEETIGTRVLIPVSLGLLELFVTKQIPEDQQVIDFIRAQCTFYLEQQTITNSDSISSDPNAQNESLGLFNQQISKENLDLPHDISIDRIHLCSSPLNPFQQFNNTSETGQQASTGIFLEGSMYESNIFTPIENGLETTQSNSIMSNSSRWMEATGRAEDQMNDESFVCENNRSDESDPNDDDDDDDTKYRRRTGKGPQSKNLVAERKRRKKLNDRLYSLRALVPKISKLDRASILGDAIDYVKELQKQVNDLQLELEEHSDNDESTRKTGKDDAENATPPSIIHQNGTKRGHKREQESSLSGFHKGSSVDNNIIISEKNRELDNSNEKVQQMEPQVEVFRLEGNEFFVKVFCEHKSGGFMKLMEALSCLGLEVTNVNSTRHTCLVSSVFKVEQRKNDQAVQADHVKESLLELTRNPSRMWSNNAAEESENGNDTEDDCHMHHNHSHYSLHRNHQLNSHHLQRLHH